MSWPPAREAGQASLTAKASNAHRARLAMGSPRIWFDGAFASVLGGSAVMTVPYATNSRQWVMR